MLKRNITANYIGQFYSIIIGIFMVPFYIKYLGTEAYGLIGFFTLMYSWMLLLDMGMSPTLSREVTKTIASDNNDTKEKFIKLLHSFESVFVLISTLLVLTVVLNSELISDSWLRVENLNISKVSYCISLMGFIIGIRFMISLYNSGISGTEQHVWQNIAIVIIQTLKFIGVLFIFEFISTDISHFFEYQLAIVIIELIVFSRKFYLIMNIKKFKLYFSYHVIKPIVPFAIGIAYAGGIWIFLTQFDKLLLSSILPLKEFGYFTIVAIVSNAIIHFSHPISKAMLPRLTYLHHHGKKEELTTIYKKSTQFITIFIFSIVGVVGTFSWELLYSWTGNEEMSTWGSEVLFWYMLGNGVLAISSFQFYLQYAHGKLDMHVKYNTVLSVLALPSIYFSAYEYGAIGVAIVWFILRLLSFLVWVPLVHRKFAPNLHKDWIVNDIMPMFISSVAYVTLLKYFNIKFSHDRLEILVGLIVIGAGLLILNILASSEARKIFMSYIKGVVK